MKQWTLDAIPDQTGRVAIVTGANTGIGFETAAALAAKGARVVLACRNPQKAEAALGRIQERTPDADLVFVDFDLASLASVEKCADVFRANHDRLDLLINNAGIMAVPLGHTVDGFELTFGCNHLWHFALTGRLVDLLQATRGARVVTVSSLTHRMGVMDFENLNAEKSYGKMAAYGQSKLANMLFHFELDRRLTAAGVPVSATAAHPGWTATNLQDNAPLIRMLNPLFSQQPADGALPTLYAATAEGVSGVDYYGPSRMFEMWGPPKPAVKSGRAQDDEVAERLWTISEELTGVRYAF